MTTKTLKLVAGAALSVSAAASAQTDQDRAYSAELRADSLTRTSLLQSGGAGYDHGAYIASGDGNYRLNINWVSQFRYTFNFRDDDDGSSFVSDDDEDFANGFEVNKLYMDFTGNMITEELTYKIRGEFQSDADNTIDESFDGDFELEDAWAQYDWDNGVSLRWGQFKVPSTFEEFYVDSHYQLAADRSVTGEAFSAGYTQGIALSYRNDAFGGTIAVDDGAKTANTPYYSAAEADIGLTGRADFKFAGDWEQFNDFTSFRGSPFAARAGAGIHWQHNGDTAAFVAGAAAPTPEYDLIQWTADVSLEGSGWNAFAAVVGRWIDPDSAFMLPSGGTADDGHDWGVIIQGGFFPMEKLELFARWDAIFPDEDLYGDGLDEDFHTVTIGGNWYFIPESHAAKFTTDIQIFLNEPDENGLVAGVAGGGVDGADIEGIAPSQFSSVLPSGEDTQIAWRLQMQLAF